MAIMRYQKLLPAEEGEMKWITTLHGTEPGFCPITNYSITRGGRPLLAEKGGEDQRQQMGGVVMFGKDGTQASGRDGGQFWEGRGKRGRGKKALLYAIERASKAGETGMIGYVRIGELARSR